MLSQNSNIRYVEEIYKIKMLMEIRCARTYLALLHSVEMVHLLTKRQICAPAATIWVIGSRRLVRRRQRHRPSKKRSSPLSMAISRKKWGIKIAMVLPFKAMSKRVSGQTFSTWTKKRTKPKCASTKCPRTIAMTMVKEVASIEG